MRDREDKPYVIHFYMRGDSTRFTLTEKFYCPSQFEKWQHNYRDVVVIVEKQERTCQSQTASKI